MARPRKIENMTTPPLPPALAAWADSIGEALGRGVARGINFGISGSGVSSMKSPTVPAAAAAPRRRGRPPKALSGTPVAADNRCIEPGCTREARSKGLCSAHYQAERRRIRAQSARPA